MVGNSAYVDEQIKSEISRQAQEQRTSFRDHFEDLRNMILQYCGSTRVITSWEGPSKTPSPSTPTRYPISSATTVDSTTTKTKKRFVLMLFFCNFCNLKKIHIYKM